MEHPLESAIDDATESIEDAVDDAGDVAREAGERAEHATEETAAELRHNFLMAHVTAEAEATRQHVSAIADRLAAETHSVVAEAEHAPEASEAAQIVPATVEEIEPEDQPEPDADETKKVTEETHTRRHFGRRR